MSNNDKDLSYTRHRTFTANSRRQYAEFTPTNFRHAPGLPLRGGFSAQTTMKINDRTCQSCRNNIDGKCAIGKRDVYEFRQLPASLGGCGDSALKYNLRADDNRLPVMAVEREAYSWR